MQETNRTILMHDIIKDADMLIPPDMFFSHKSTSIDF